MNDPSAKIFYTGRYSYRRKGVIFGGGFILGLGVFFLSGLMGAFPGTTWSWQTISILIFTGGISGTMAFTGLVMISHWLKRSFYSMEISETGIKYGKKFYPWSKIKWISGYSDKGKMQLFCGLRGFSADRHLMTDEGLTQEEYSSLMNSLQTTVHPEHTHLVLGG